MSGNKTISTMAVKLVGEVRDYETKMQQASRVTRDSAASISGSLNAAARGTRTFNESQNLVARTSRLTGMRLQQAGYQVQDFFVQVGSGTSAMRAFSQQAPQFLGVFGPAGAIAGAALSIGAVVAQIVMAGRETGKSAEKLKTYAEYARDLRLQMDRIRFDALSPSAQADELRNQIADITAEIRKMIKVINDLENFRRGQSWFNLQNFVSAATGFGISPSLGPAAGQALEEEQARVGKLQNELLALQQRLKQTQADIAKPAADAAKKQLDELKSEADAIIKRNLTPLEKFNDSIKRLDEVFAKRGLLSVEQYNREVRRLQAELDPVKDTRRVEPTTDRFRQLGLLTDPLRKTGPTQQETEEKKQTTILEQIKTILERTPLQPNERLTQGALWLA